MSKQKIYDDISICHFDNCYKSRVKNTPFCEKHQDIPVSREDVDNGDVSKQKASVVANKLRSDESSDNQDKYKTYLDFSLAEREIIRLTSLGDYKGTDKWLKTWNKQWISREDHEKEIKQRELVIQKNYQRLLEDSREDHEKEIKQRELVIQKNYQRLLEDEQRQKAELHNENIKLKEMMARMSDDTYIRLDEKRHKLFLEFIKKELCEK